jgi:hypothetical protein
VAEEKAVGNVGLKDWLDLLSYSIGCSALVIYILLSIISSIAQLVPSYILAYWSAMSLEE